MIDFGTVRPGTTLYVPFATYDSNDPTASVTMTGFAVTDIEIYKDGGTTQRASDAGYTLLDTDGIDFDGVTGIHGFSVDLADNTTAGFYAAGSQYWIVVSSVTVDSGTINFIAGTFRIGYEDAILNTTIATLSSQTSFTLTAGPAEDDALNGCVCCIHDVASMVQCGFAVISDYTGSTKTVTLAAGTTFTVAASDNISIFYPANTKTISPGSITSASFASDAITAAAIAADAIGASELAADAATEIGTAVWITASRTLTANTNLNDPTSAAIADAVWDEARSGHVSAGSFGEGVASVQGGVTGAVGSIGTGGITASSFGAGAVNAAALATDAATEVANAVAAITIEGSLDLIEAIKLVLAASAGKVSGADGSTITIRDTTDTYNRIVATVDQYGNRNAVTYVTT